MLIKIIVFSLITVVIAMNVQYTEEDARKDILTIINYAFGHKTHGHLSERNRPLKLDQNERNKDIQAMHRGSQDSRTGTRVDTEHATGLNVNQPLHKTFKTSPRLNQPTGRKILHQVNERRPINITESKVRDDSVIRNQGQFNSCDFEQTNDRSTIPNNENTKMRSTEHNTREDTRNKINTTPSSKTYNITLKNEVTSRNRDNKINKTGVLTIETNNSTLLNNKKVTLNQTENTSQKITPKEVTVKPQIKKITPMIIDGVWWIWDDVTTTTNPTPDLDDRAAFEGGNCPTGYVKFDNMCKEED